MKQENPLGLRRPIVTGLMAILVLVLGLGAWAALTRISGAVIARGRVDVAQSRQIVQHPEGGEIAEILATEGQQVQQGDLLIRLAGREERAALQSTEQQLAEAALEIARLQAESAGAARFEPTLLKLPGLAAGAAARDQMAVFASRRAALSAELARLSQMRAESQAQITSVGDEIAAQKRQLELIRNDIATQSQLLKKGLTPAATLSGLQREEARLAGALAGMQAAKAQLWGQLSQIAADERRLLAGRMDEIATALQSRRADERRLSEKRDDLAAKVAALDIRAPLSGRIFGLRTTSSAAVLRPMEPILYIVPNGRPFVVQAHISPRDAEQVRLGQAAHIRLPLRNADGVIDLTGTLSNLSADTIADEAGGDAYYVADITLASATTANQMQTLRPGLPVEVFLATETQTPLSYVTEPLRQFFSHAMRDRTAAPLSQGPRAG